MVATVSRLIRQNTHTLRSRLVLFTVMMVIMSCSTLSWYFVNRQIDSAADTLLKSGELLGSQLAATAQYSIYVKDTRRLQELLRGALALEDVSYIFVSSRDNHVLGAAGKPDWKRLVGNRMASDWLPWLAARRSEALEQKERPAATTKILRIVNGQPVTESSFLSSAGRWFAVLFGSDRPLFYDIVIPVRSSPLSVEPDLALGLTLDETPIGADAPPDLSTSLSGVVQVGLTDRAHQSLLRQLVWQVAVITVAIIMFGIVIVMYIARRMTHPLNQLAVVAREVGAGNLSASVTSYSSDEIGELSRVFNQMTTSLQSREQELKDLNRTLEAKVERRTYDLKEANQRLQELDRLKTALVSNASHELRTPLTSIKVHVKNLLDGVRGTLGADQLDSLGRVQSNVERLRTLIDDLLDLSRLHTGRAEMRQETVALTPLIHEVVDSLRYFSELKEMSITSTLSSDLPEIPADREKLRRIFTNVIHNAIKFTSPGGRILIEGRQDTGGTVTVSVQDSGQGIAPEERDKVFLPFFRSGDNATQIRGSGLGLSIAKELVELHHGVIWVESTAGKGSCFFVRLPTATGDTTASTPAVQRLRI